MEAALPTPATATHVARSIVQNVNGVLEGKRATVELAVACLLAKGHLLIEDVPGVGKTTLARALARSVGVDFRRIQFTSDLMPADLLGGRMYDTATGQFNFHKGPVFTHVLLADEINRTTPKTQSALLEVMDERRISLDGHTYALAEPFLVVATQNPEDFHGTYALPESQLDRFLMRLHIGYPPEKVEREVIRQRRWGDPTENLRPVTDMTSLLAAQDAVDKVQIDDDVVDYLHALVLATRQSPLLQCGASTRAAIALERAVRALALVHGRAYATPDDVKTLAVVTLAHRVRPHGIYDTAGSSSDAERIVRDLLETLPVPV